MDDGGDRQPAPAGAGCYATFCTEVARRQLRDWLVPTTSSDVLLDITPGAPSAAIHRRVVSLHGSPTATAAGASLHVRGDDEMLDCIRPASVSGIVAEKGSLARCAVTEETLRESFRVLKPGGRMLLCLESLRHGLAELAAAGRWAELADAPQADVVLLPTDDGHVRRCFTVEELQGALDDAGFAVDWIRPRTVLPPEAVERAVAADPAALPTMVATELRLAAEWAGEIAGSWLLASAARPR